MDTAQLITLGAIGAIAAVLFGVRRRRHKVAREAYSQALADAVADGVLSDDEVQELETIQKKGALTALDVRSAGLAVYRDALEEVASDARLTPEEDATLHRLQAQLGLTDSDLSADLTQLARLRLLARIDQGHFTEVRSPIQLVPDEVCYWVVQCTLAERLAVRSSRQELQGVTFRIADVQPFAVLGDRDELRPAEDILPSDLGVLVVTSRRTVFQGARRTVSVPHTRLDAVTLYEDGVRVDELKPPARRYFLTEDAELAAAVMIQAARQRRRQIKPATPGRSA
jgi:hypothetical protein